MEALINVIAFINSNILWGIPLIVAIMGTGLILSIRSRFLQVRKFNESLESTIVPTVKSIFKSNKDNEDLGKSEITQFQAFSAAISGTVGTGNIVGVAGAMLAGGPGAVFWMWVSAFFGLVTNYSENVLGLYFRKKDQAGDISGGPMYYISEGLGMKGLAFIFSFCCLLAAVGMGMVQANSLSGTVQAAISQDPGQRLAIALFIGTIVSVVTGLIVLGGIKRIGAVASLLVPFMALLFMICTVIVLIVNYKYIPFAFSEIFSGAFSLKSVTGGVFGYVITMGMRYGFARGVFSNEAGLGSSVIAHSASSTKEPVLQGLWGIFEVFFDTFVICTLTAITLIVVGKSSGVIDFANIAANGAISKNDIASLAFSETFGSIGMSIFSIIIPLFAFTTILAWSFYGVKACTFIFSKHVKKASFVFLLVYIVMLFLGAIAKSDLVWELSDMFNALMALPNLFALVLLSGTIVKISDNYFRRKGGEDIEPMLSAYPERNRELAKSLDK